MHRSSHKAPKSARIVILNILAAWAAAAWAEREHAASGSAPAEPLSKEGPRRWQRPLLAGRSYNRTARYNFALVLNPFSIFILPEFLSNKGFQLPLKENIVELLNHLRMLYI